MVIVIKSNTDIKRIEEIAKDIEKKGVKTKLTIGENKTIIGLIGDTKRVSKDYIMSNLEVEDILKVESPYKLVSRMMKEEDSIIEVKGVRIGAKDQVIVMAGPCSVESREQIIDIAKEVKKQGANILRGGAFKPRTSPYSFQGLKEEGLKYLKEASNLTNMPMVTELMSVDDLEVVSKYADIIQIGARNMQNFALLKAVGKTNKPVLLKRGMSATIEEFLMAAEYIMSQGNENVILCERGIRTFETYLRNTLDLAVVPAIKELSHLPIIIDPSHATGRWNMVEPLSKAAVAIGADGLMIEVHNDPKNALSDGAQSLKYKNFSNLMKSINKIKEII